VPLSNSEDSIVRKEESVEVWQVIPLILAATLLTTGLAMFLGGTSNVLDIARPTIVVFGGTTVALLVTFPVTQILRSWQVALARGIFGGTAPLEMIRALLKVCDICRRDGLLGVADIRSNSAELEEVCHLIGDASEDATIQFALERRLASERLYHQMVTDVFAFTSLYALLVGMLGSLLLYVGGESDQLSHAAILPFVCGASLAIMMTIMIGRLRASHLRELIVSEIAYRGASIILEDNNVQRLHARLVRLLPAGIHR
jgi:hypothetical protein